MLCRKCKMEIPNGAKICTHCGSKQGVGCGGVITVIVAIIVIIVTVSILANIGKGVRQDQERTAANQTSAANELTKDEYIASCKEIEYSDLARNPDKYKGQAFRFRGKVIQTVSEGVNTYLRVDVTEGKYIWSDTVFAKVYIPQSADKILEGDIITFYGDCEGEYTYESVFGKQVSLPSISIRFFSIEEVSE